MAAQSPNLILCQKAQSLELCSVVGIKVSHIFSSVDTKKNMNVIYVCSHGFLLHAFLYRSGNSGF